MCVDFKPIDNFKLTGRLQNNFACGYSEDDRIFVISETGVYVLTLKGYLTSVFPTFSCKKSYFKVSEYSPCANVDLDVNSFIYQLPKDDLYECMIRTELSASLKSATPVEANCRVAKWSPKDFINKTDCALGVLTNLYSLEIYARHVDENEIEQYVMVLNVTQEIINHKKHDFKSSDRMPGPKVKLNELIRRVEYVAPTAFAWSHQLEIDGKSHCVIFVGHNKGCITVLRLSGETLNDSEDKIRFLGRYTTNLKQISSLCWHQTKKFGGGLCIGDVEGKMSVVNINNLDENEVVIDNETAFCTETDKTVDKITVITNENCTFIILVKQSYLMFYGIDNFGQVFDLKVYNAENLYITGIEQYENSLLVLTFTGIFKQLNLSVVHNKISIEEKVLTLKLDLVKFRTHGFFLSRNKVLFGVLAFSCRLRNMVREKLSINVFLFQNNSIKPLELLLRNSTGSLRHFWDCFETLRLICIKEQRFPWLGIDLNLNYDTLSLLQLKTLRHIAKLSETVYSIVPRITSYEIKSYVLLHYLVNIKLVVKRINNLLNLRNSGKELSIFQMRSIDIENFFLKEMVVKEILAKANVGENFVNDVHHVISICNELKYPDMVQCHWCGEKIIGPLCLPPHADSRCALSMMPIYLIPGYKCPFCKCLLHQEIEKEQDRMFCPYCDIPMVQRLTKKIETVIGNASGESKVIFKNAEICPSEEIKSDCFEDCLKEDIDFGDIGENNSEYVLFSDSDSETEDRDKLRELYFRVANMNLKDVRSDIVSESSEKDCAGPSEKLAKLDEGVC